jgi:two-component system nitrogen regulation sensor histidine kinase GlnL
MSQATLQTRAALSAIKAAGFDSSPDPAIVLAAAGDVLAANEAAEILFGRGLSQMARAGGQGRLPPASPLAALASRCAAERGVLREWAVEVSLFGRPPIAVDAVATPLADGAVLLSLHTSGAFSNVERAFDIPGRRSALGLGQMLAHEIKNPLAGIRGAAQLLGGAVGAEDAPLAQLIVEETDRIRRLVDRMEAFSETAPPALAPVNIHQVLDRVRALAVNGVAEGLTIREFFDPSLPPALGDEDQLIQVFLNLVKNAAESARDRGDGRGEIVLATAYRHGIRVRGGGSETAPGAPLEVRVIDNGAGIPANLREHLFQPFITTKTNGAGLGLALSAKLVAGHRGLIDFESEAGRTCFRVLLPVAPHASRETHG